MRPVITVIWTFTACAEAPEQVDPVSTAGMAGTATAPEGSEYVGCYEQADGATVTGGFVHTIDVGVLTDALVWVTYTDEYVAAAGGGKAALAPVVLDADGHVIWVCEWVHLNAVAADGAGEYDGWATESVELVYRK